MDKMVKATQEWLNSNYGADSRYKKVDEDGQTGWSTIYGLTRALQIELGIQSTADSFGPTTQSLFEKRWPTGIVQQSSGASQENNVYGIIQGALWCKGYSTGAGEITRHFYSGTGSAIKKLKQDMGLNDSSSTVTVDIMKALLSMDQFVLLRNSGGKSRIREIQQDINRKYASFTGIIPTDGLYGRNMNKAMIKILQSFEGYTGKNIDGVFGNGTKSKLLTLTKESSAKNPDWFWLAKVMLNCNTYDFAIDASWAKTLQYVKEFQKEYCIPESETVDTCTWMSLFVSCGDRDRKAKACDTRFEITDSLAKVLKEDGFSIVGRYLTGGDFKEIRGGELKRILDNGMEYFPIYQENGTKVEYFTREAGKTAGMKASDAALKKGVPPTVIYFAVDCDVMDYQIDKYIVPYFRAINEVIDSRYMVGIYASRNVCSRVAEEGFAVSSFVSDMSTGYSGNLGFPIPKNWNYDQFTELKKYSGSVDIDKDAYSGRVPACSETVKPDEYYQYELPTLYDMDKLSTLTKMEDVISIFGEIEDAYREYADFLKDCGVAVLHSPEVGCLQYLAQKYYKEDDLIHRVGFRMVTSTVVYDSGFEKYIDSKYTDIREKIEPFLTGEDLWDGKIGVIDLPHLAITTLTYYRCTVNENSWNGWAGDLVSAYSLVDACAKMQNCYPSLRIARAFIGGSNPESDLGLRDAVENKCNYVDLCSDGYAVIFAEMLKKNNDAHSAAVSTFIDNAGNEFNALLRETGAKNDLLDLREKISELVTKYGVDYLTIVENSGIYSSEAIQSACIWAYANWLYKLCN